ncbi:hypothetical protein YC2023_029072 [Brassica napus]
MNLDGVNMRSCPLMRSPMSLMFSLEKSPLHVVSVNSTPEGDTQLHLECTAHASSGDESSHLTRSPHDPTKNDGTLEMHSIMLHT